MRKGFSPTDHILSWGKRGACEARKLSEQTHVDVWQIEDGFLRSFGLGSDFNRPSSLVIDKRGIYYDPSAPSDLEYLLNHYELSEDESAQALEFKKNLVESTISKYILGDQRPLDTLNSPKTATKRILIPGQVEDDASILNGTLDIATNEQLILAVRNNNPEAYIIYKPHPDVLSGNRKGSVNEHIILENCDAMETKASIIHCLKGVEEVHTMTSLVGFEGLIHGCTVHCYGLPFYAGWGLTQDRHSCFRRNKTQNLLTLIYASYFLYPTYYDWDKHQYTTATDTLANFTQIAKEHPITDHKNPVYQRLSKYRNMLSGAYHSLFTDIKKA